MLLRNDIFTIDAQRYRLLEYTVEGDAAWVIALDHETAWPQRLDRQALLDAAQSDQESPASFEPSDTTLRRRDEALARIAPLLTSSPAVFDRNVRGPLIRQRAAEVGCSERTLHKDLRRFWRGGQTADALLPEYRNSGRVEDGGTARRGRKRSDGHETYQLTAADLELLERHIKATYLKDSRCTITAAHQLLRERHYTVTDGNGKRWLTSAGAHPSFRQFSRFLRNKFSLETRIRSREGDKDFERDHRAKLGSVLEGCRGVGDYYEIDATIADVYLVSSADVNKIVGKPTLYLIIDRKSRLIVGWYVGLEQPSWTGAMEAILSIAQDKAALCARYGVSYNPDDWPADGMFPRQFLADRGSEMLSMHSSQIASSLHVTVTNLPGLRPDWKPLVECGFKLLHESIKDVAPAYDPPSNAMKRRGKHYEKDACLTLKDFGNIVLNAIIAQNRKVMRGYDLNLRELADGVEPTPIALWNHSVASSVGLLTRYSESRVRAALMPQDSAVVTDEGIIFRDCHYTCTEAIEGGWFVQARKKRFRVKVSFDSRLADSILVHPLSAKGEPFAATLSTRSEKYRGFSFAEVRFYEGLREAMSPALEQSRSQNMHDFHQRVEPVVAAARKRLQDEKRTTSRSARRADIRADRYAELCVERAERLTSSEPASPPAHTAEVVSLPRPRPPAARGQNSSVQPPMATNEDHANQNTEPQTLAQRLQEARRRMMIGES